MRSAPESRLSEAGLGRKTAFRSAQLLHKHKTLQNDYVLEKKYYRGQIQKTVRDRQARLAGVA